jgi:hypothetical protein
MKRNLKIMIFIFSLAIFSACGGGVGGNTNDPNIGFFLRADRYETSQTTQTTLRFPTLMRVQGQFLEPRGTIRGTLEQIPTTDFFNIQHFLGTKVPARWRFTYIELPQPGRIPCQPAGGVTERNVNPGEVEPLPCYATVFPIAVSPSLIDGQSPPSTIEIQAEGISNEHAPPRVTIYNEFGVLKANQPVTISNLVKGRVQIETPSLTGFTTVSYTHLTLPTKA